MPSGPASEGFLYLSAHHHLYHSADFRLYLNAEVRAAAAHIVEMQGHSEMERSTVVLKFDKAVRKTAAYPHTHTHTLNGGF